MSEAATNQLQVKSAGIGSKLVSWGVYYNHTFDDMVQNYHKYIDWLLLLKKDSENDDVGDSDACESKLVLQKIGDKINLLVDYYLQILNVNGEKYLEEHPSKDPYDIELDEEEMKTLDENDDEIFNLLSFGMLHAVLTLSDPLSQQYISNQLRNVVTLESLQAKHFTYHQFIFWLRKRIIADHTILTLAKRNPNKIIYEMLCANDAFRKYYDENKHENIFPIINFQVAERKKYPSKALQQLEFESFVNAFNEKLHFQHRINEPTFVHYLDNYAFDDEYFEKEIEYYRENGIACDVSYSDYRCQNILMAMTEDEQIYLWTHSYLRHRKSHENFPKIFRSMRRMGFYDAYTTTRSYLLSLYRKGADRNLSLYECGVIKFTKDPGMYRD